jgi:glycosyltransferase involved in cell wall biosynthesis
LSAIHQFIPTLAPKDAIGAHTLALRELLRDLGWESEIYAWEAKDNLASVARPWQGYRKPRGKATVWLWYQGSIASPIADFLAARSEPKVLNYHNITPYELVAGWEEGLAKAVVFGRQQIARLAPHVTLAMAVSRFNADDLRGMGYRRLVVAPLLLQESFFSTEPDPEVLEALQEKKASGGLVWLFVGRLSPHKAQHRLIAALALFRRAYDPGARLWLVGSVASVGYEAALRRYAAELGLGDAVVFAGSVSEEALVAYYKEADCFVCASEHEGFCVPVVEALWNSLPVVALAKGALPETVGDAGLLVADSRPATLAAAVAKVAHEGPLRAELARRGPLRAWQFHPSVTRHLLAELIMAELGRP